jgi:hypothetical protein
MTDQMPVVPTLVVYIGNSADHIKSVRDSVESRLHEYVGAGIVFGESLAPNSLREAILPGFDQVFGNGNSLRFRDAKDSWLAYGVNKQIIRVLVCVLDAACEVADLKHIYDQINRNLNVNGVQAEVALLWCRPQNIAASELAYAPQMYVNPERLQNPLGVIEHGVVLWVTTSLANRVHEQVRELQITNAQKKTKSVIAVWLSAAAMYVDISYIRTAMRERIYNQFMRAWQSNDQSTQAKDELQAIAGKHASAYDVNISEALVDSYQRLGWILKSQDAFVYRQTRLVDDDMSGFPRIDTSLAKGMFGNAVSWWLGRWSTQVPSLLVGLIDKVRMVFNRAVELDIPNQQTVARAIKAQYQEVHKSMRDDLKAANERVYDNLQGFFFSHLLKYDDLSNRDYGLKRMLFVIDKYTNALEKPAKVELYKQLTGKAEVISPIHAVTDDYFELVSNEHADRMQRLHLKWKRERASLLSLGGLIIRAIVLYPLLLSLLYALVPVYFVQGPLSAILLAGGLVVVALVLYTWSYMAYFANIERDRDSYFADTITPVMLSISAHYLHMYRQQLVVKLRRLHDIYNDIDVMINKHVMTAEMPIDNVGKEVHYIIRNIEIVFGSSMIFVDDTYKGEPWIRLRNENIWAYTHNKMPHLSWWSMVKFRLNNLNDGKYKAEVSLLQELAGKLYNQRRHGETALDQLRIDIEKEVNIVTKTNDISIDVQIEQVSEMINGGKWCWLAEHSNIDTVPRSTDGFDVHKFSYVVLNNATLLAGASGDNSQCYKKYPPSGILLSRLGNEMSRIELEYDVTG